MATLPREQLGAPLRTLLPTLPKCVGGGGGQQALVNGGYLAKGWLGWGSRCLHCRGVGGSGMATGAVPTTTFFPTPTSWPRLSHFQVSPSEKTPAWCGPESLKDHACPHLSHFQVPPSEKTPAWCGPESLKDHACPHLSHFQVPPSEKTPAWCGPESLKDRAGPKSWRGVGAALEDWGELNTGECVWSGEGEEELDLFRG